MKGGHLLLGWKKRRSGLSTQWGPEAMLLSAGLAAQGGRCLIRTQSPGKRREVMGGSPGSVVLPSGNGPAPPHLPALTPGAQGALLPQPLTEILS